MRILPLFFSLALLSLALLGCGSSNAEPTPTVSPTETAVTVFRGTCTPEGPLRLYNWPVYMDPALLDTFADLYHIEVIEEAAITSNEQVVDEVRQGEIETDLIVVADYAILTLSEEGLLETLNPRNIPNLPNLSTSLDLYYDPVQRYSVPYQWGSTGIAYDSTVFEEPPASWAQLFEPELAEPYAGKFTMLDDERQSIGAALLYLGYTIDDTDPEHLAEARELLLRQKPWVAAYDSTTFFEGLADGRYQMSHAWNGLAALAATENKDIRFVVPQEGALLFMDNMAIPKGAAHKCTAELFMNYLLEPAVAAQLSSFTHFLSPVPAARPLLSPEAQRLMERGFDIDPATLAQLEWARPLEDPTPFHELWAEVQGQ